MKTCDLVDQHSAIIQVADPIGLRHFGALREFHGAISTLNCYEDNSVLKQVVSQPGDGKVLVVDGGGSKRCALIGDSIAGIAIENRWNGIIINGYIRDSEALGKLPFGVLALGTNPRKSAKENNGVFNENIYFAGVSFVPGHYVYADDDGIVISPQSLCTAPRRTIA